jgi:hypothetical protein
MPPNYSLPQIFGLPHRLNYLVLPLPQMIDSGPLLARLLVIKVAMKIKVLIVDVSPVMRKAVRQLLSEEAGIGIVGEAASLTEMLAIGEQHKPEIVIMDFAPD